MGHGEISAQTLQKFYNNSLRLKLNKKPKIPCGQLNTFGRQFNVRDDLRYFKMLPLDGTICPSAYEHIQIHCHTLLKRSVISPIL